MAFHEIVLPKDMEKETSAFVVRPATKQGRRQHGTARAAPA